MLGSQRLSAYLAAISFYLLLRPTVVAQGNAQQPQIPIVRREACLCPNAGAAIAPAQLTAIVPVVYQTIIPYVYTYQGATFSTTITQQGTSQVLALATQRTDGRLEAVLSTVSVIAQVADAFVSVRIDVSLVVVVIVTIDLQLLTRTLTITNLITVTETVPATGVPGSSSGTGLVTTTPGTGFTSNTFTPSFSNTTSTGGLAPSTTPPSATSSVPAQTPTSTQTFPSATPSTIAGMSTLPPSVLSSTVVIPSTLSLVPSSSNPAASVSSVTSSESPSSTMIITSSSLLVSSTSSAAAACQTPFKIGASGVNAEIGLTSFFGYLKPVLFTSSTESFYNPDGNYVTASDPTATLFVLDNLGHLVYFSDPSILATADRNAGGGGGIFGFSSPQQLESRPATGPVADPVTCIREPVSNNLICTRAAVGGGGSIIGESAGFYYLDNTPFAYASTITLTAQDVVVCG